MANKNNIDKRISYDGRRTIKDPTYDIYKKGGPVQLELPLEDPNNNIVPFTPKPGSPIKRTKIRSLTKKLNTLTT